MNDKDEEKGPIGLDLTRVVPDYTKSYEENREKFRKKYKKVYGEEPPWIKED